ncbi:MAG: hemagglutinin repeat-containing protein, partial [Nostoc sp. CmiVER01]|uniref:hemagglutinin repeat-containing protein n=1 Tax=Nostoc sp. CmiVER01 TaxID=3075384 RepID=UPI003D160D59
MGQGIGILIGSASDTRKDTLTQTTHAGSLIGSTDGAVKLSAGNDVHVTGSEVLSQTGTTVVGRNVTIDAAADTTDTSARAARHTGGINVGLGGAVADLANGALSSARRANEVTDDRLKALHGAQAAWQAHDAYQAAQNGAGQLSRNGTDGGINLQVGIGGSAASTTTTTHDEQAQGSTLRSGGATTIVATDGDVNVIGSHVQARDVTLAATRDVNVRSQAEDHRLKNENDNRSAGVGLQIGTDGVGIYA